MNEQPEWMHRAMERLERKVDLIENHLSGGSEPTRGLLVRIDRLEGSEERRRTVLKWIGASSITATVASVFAWLKSHP